MSMQPQPWPEVPTLTARVAWSAFGKGALAMRARDELGAWYDDAAFAGLSGLRGALGISPAQLAMVTVWQFTKDLTDRRAADAVRGRLDWKYCLGLALEDQGFDFSVLSEFRSRLVVAGQERMILDLLLDKLADVTMTGPIHDNLALAGLAPAEHAVDAGYASADEPVTAQQRGTTLIEPLLATATRPRRTGGYTPMAARHSGAGPLLAITASARSWTH